jgi:hypothetical protein
MSFFLFIIRVERDALSVVYTNANIPVQLLFICYYLFLLLAPIQVPHSPDECICLLILVPDDPFSAIALTITPPSCLVRGPAVGLSAHFELLNVMQVKI